MRSSFTLFSFCTLFLFLLTGCTDTTGLSAASSKSPKGNPDAVVTVQEFSDLQCPACRTVHMQVVTPLIAQYGDRIRLEFKHFPLQSIHPYALRAAMAAECAADQGKFWEYVDLAYQKQGELSADILEQWASELALDADLFHRCLVSNIKRDTVLADYDTAKQLHLRGTPTFLVNGLEVPTNELVKAIEEAETSAKQRL